MPWGCIRKRAIPLALAINLSFSKFYDEQAGNLKITVRADWGETHYDQNEPHPNGQSAAALNKTHASRAPKLAPSDHEGAQQIDPALRKECWKAFQYYTWVPRSFPDLSALRKIRNICAHSENSNRPAGIHRNLLRH